MLKQYLKVIGNNTIFIDFRKQIENVALDIYVLAIPLIVINEILFG